MQEIARRILVLATLLLVALPLAAQTPPYVRTIVVGGAGAPLTNGANLVNALSSISSPGPANRWLVKVEPGVFDIGTLALVLRDYVDVEGSGRGVTVLTSIKGAGSAVIDPVTAATISTVGATVFAPAGVHAELRELSVENRCSNDAGIGVYVLSSSVLLSRVSVDVQTPVSATGIALGNDPRLVEVSVRSECTWNQLQSETVNESGILDGLAICSNKAVPGGAQADDACGEDLTWVGASARAEIEVGERNYRH